MIETEKSDRVIHQADNERSSSESSVSKHATSDISGRLSPDAKRALVSLLRMGAILANQKPALFELIRRYEKPIQEHLADMYLRLMLDLKGGVAIILQQDVAREETDEDEIYSLIPRRTLTIFDTLLLLILRKHYQEREVSGEQKIIINLDQIEANLTPFIPLTDYSRGDKKRLNVSVTKMIEKRVLNKIRGEDERYEITPVIRYVVNAEFLERLLTEYQKLAKNPDGIESMKSKQDGDGVMADE